MTMRKLQGTPEVLAAICRYEASIGHGRDGTPPGGDLGTRTARVVDLNARRQRGPVDRDAPCDGCGSTTAAIVFRFTDPAGHVGPPGATGGLCGPCDDDAKGRTA